MDTQQPYRRIPEFRFRVLIVGRANSGKTTILQRVCETTASPAIYRGGVEVKLDPSVERGEHRIDDELVFSNHMGYIFHDSRGIESGGVEELEALKRFIRHKCRETRLRDKLHAIWYCIPMDNQRPQLDLKFYKDICPDQNVPIIAVFTKYEQFLYNVEMDVSDYPDKYPDSGSSAVAEKLFQEHYLRPLGDNVRHVRLQQMHKKDGRCDGLIEETAASLNEDVVVLMLLAVQRGNIELSVKTALSHLDHLTDVTVEDVIQKCLAAFPHIWLWGSREHLGIPLSLSLEEALKEHSLSESLSALGYHSPRGPEFLLSSIVGYPYGNLLLQYTEQVISMPTIQNLIRTILASHHLIHFILAVLIILKHASFLQLSKSPQAALSQAEWDYQVANVDSDIQEHLAAFSSEISIKKLADFIMATNLMPSQPSANT